MPRLRTVKPSFFTNDQLAEVPPLGRLLFVGLWCYADREGRLEDRPKRLQVEVLPYDSCDVDALLDDLARRGFIQRYAVGGQRYIAIPAFKKHQSPHLKEAASTIPAPDADVPSIDKHRESTVQAPDEHSAFRAGMDYGLWTMDSGNGPRNGAPPAAPQPPVLAVRADAPDARTGPHGRPRDPVWDELERIFGPPRTKVEHGRRNEACKQLREGSASPAEIARAHAAWPNVMKDATETPLGLAANLGVLLNGPQVNGRSNGTVTEHRQRVTQAALVPRELSLEDARRLRRGGTDDRERGYLGAD